MTGLNLETFLHLLRADLGAWASLGLIALVLALMTWTSWGSRRALRKCLVLSIVAHCGLVLYGSTMPVVMLALDPEGRNDGPREHVRQIQVAPWSESGRAEQGSGGKETAFDRPRETLALAENKVSALSPETPVPTPVRPKESGVAPESAAPEAAPPAPPEPEPRPAAEAPKDPAPAQVAQSGPSEVDEPEKKRGGAGPAATILPARDDRLRTGSVPSDAPRLEAPNPADIPKLTAPAFKVEVAARPGTPSAPAADLVPPGLTESKGPEVAAPEVVRSAPPVSGFALSQADLRRGGRGANPGDGLVFLPPARGRASRPPLLAGPDLFAPGPASPTERPLGMETRPGEAPATVAAGDPSASGVITEVETRPAAPPPRASLPEPDIRRPGRPAGGPPELSAPRHANEDAGPLALARVAPSGVGRLPDVSGTTGGRPLSDVPEVYRSRLDPDRSALAQRAGASAESEQAVERALDWLKRHQDLDGRWDAATARFDDGTAKKGDDDFTVHCPPGETCFGECLYWEADTALTGLALLAYLGAGYTQTDGKYAETVGKGIDFLVREQKPDGDLRGPSRAVGMYCHAMATLALCEAFALSGDERLRAPVAKAVDFLARGRARDGMSWRYAPGEPFGDTSILGWAVLALKSAKVVGVPVPATTRTGTIAWLNKVAGGPNRGLARYLPEKPVTPTMTAEAWVCRQFLGVGGPGAASAEAADYLLEHGPERDPYNLYYWYYGTLAMYQHGGDGWYRWNAQVRDQVVRRQRAQGHQRGSWDPDDSLYGTTGGRIYCTALATLTLEVYYRFLRLYEEPKTSPPVAPAAPTRRLGARPRPAARGR